ncbi:hypothetical protein [Stutzerimonas nitrititolerans]|uniref:hypothetical protein n=1 Tax=Stutzerimonas nitrititolerans TaxID=2482751 RepID=UPI0028ACC97B|nr:hypothetical protein [Stutzerimonas nitrititolerans]
MKLLTPKLVRSLVSEEIICVGKTDEVKAASANNYISIVRQLFILSKWLEGGLSKDPYPSLMRDGVVSKLRPAAYWSAPEEPMALLLVRKAIEVVRELPREVLPKYLAYIQAVNDANDMGLDKKKAVSNFAQKVLDGERFSDTPVLGGLLNSYNASRPADLARLIKRIQEACFIIIAFTSGPRVSEIRRLNSKSLMYRRHINGEEYPFIFAKRSKRKYSHISKSSAPAGESDDPWILSPAGVEAFQTLVSISRPIKERSGIDNLWACYSGNGLWPLRRKTTTVSITSSGRFNERLNSFADFVGLTALDGWKFKLHSHMGRKHFARFVVKRDRGALGDLAIQYSHATAVSVDISYAMPDGEFKRLVYEELAEAMDAVVEDLSGLSESQVYSASMADGSSRIQKFLGRVLRDSDVKRLLAAGTKLIPCQWGYCLYDEKSSACQGGRELPNPINRSPDICSSCSNFHATPVHYLWWEEYRQDSLRVLSWSGMPEQVVKVVKARLDKAVEVLGVIAKG